MLVGLGCCPRDPVEGGNEAELTSVWDEVTRIGGNDEPENGSYGTTLEEVLTESTVLNREKEASSKWDLWRRDRVK